MAVDASGLEAAIREVGMELTENALDTFVEWAIMAAPVGKTGELIGSIESSGAEDRGNSIGGIVECTAEYGLYQDEGTGGSHKDPGFLVFEGDDGELVFTHDTRGVPATHFWTGTIDRGPEIWQLAAT